MVRLLQFGSYKKSGELKKIHVWLSVHQGQIEFLTPGDSYKVKRVRRNSQVILTSAPRTAPQFPARHKSGRAELMRVYRAYWKIHPILMTAMIGLRVWIGILLKQRVVVRIQPDDPNPLAGLTDPVS